jgi:hypothetical protein
VLDTRAAFQHPAAMPSVLIVHHTPSPALHAMFDAVRSGAMNDAIDGVDVVVRAALSATATDVLAADAYLLGTPANLGYMSGALKHFFDQIYYPCLEDTVGRPLRRVPARQQRHHRRGARDRADHHGVAVARGRGPGPGDR